MFRSKKGIVGLTLQQTIGLILAFMFILISVVVIAKMLHMFTGPPDQGTLQMYNRIFNSVDVMMNPANHNDTCKISTGYIEPNYAIVGFNKEGTPNSARQTGTRGDEEFGYIEEHCGIDDNIYKPRNCFNLACLCVCNGGSGDISGDDCSNSDATCKRVSPDVNDFKTNYGGRIVDLVLYGESCWQGSDNAVIAGYILRKQGTTITIDAVMDNAGMPSGVPECDELVESFNRGQRQAAATPEAAAPTERNDLDPSVARARQDTGSNIVVNN